MKTSEGSQASQGYTFSGSSKTPLVTSVYPTMRGQTDHGQPYLKVPSGRTELQVSLSFSAEPVMKGSSSFSSEEFSKLISLQFLQPSTKQLEYGKYPIRISAKRTSKQQYLIAAVFSLKEEITKRHDIVMNLHLDMEHLVTPSGKDFELIKGLVLPSFIMELGDREARFERKKEGSRKVEGETDKIRNRIEAEDGTNAVKCLCVHGSCKQGESRCKSPCDPGWRGTLCDMPKQSAMVHTKEAITTDEKVKSSKMVRDRRRDAEKTSRPVESYAH